MANKSNGIGINKISFYTLLSLAVLHMIATVLSLIGIGSTIVGYLQGVATAVALCILAFIAWRYVDSKPTSWKILYFIILLIALAGVILPLVI
jgi:hypothetical protein